MSLKKFLEISVKSRWLLIAMIVVSLVFPSLLIFAETTIRSGNVIISAWVPARPLIIPSLQIYDVQVLEITDSSALIYWKTDQSGTSQINYGKTDGLEIGAISDSSFATEHRMRLNNLEANTEYHFQVKGRSQYGAESWSGIYEFKTLADTSPPANVSDFTVTSGIREIKLSWKNPPDEDFKGVRITRGAKFFPLSPEEGIIIYDGSEESFLDKNLTPETTYYYSAFTYDVSGNFASGANAWAVPYEVLPLVPPLPPPPIPPEVIPPVEVEILKLTDFHFRIAKKTINVLPDPLNIFRFLPGTILHLSIETEKLPKVLKTIMVVIGDKSYLLRVDEAEKFYQAGIILPVQEGLQPIYILVFNFKEGTMDKVEAHILNEPFGLIKSPVNNLAKRDTAGNIVQASEKEELVYLAKVTLYQYDEVSGDWLAWQALKYSQRNPIFSNPKGQYGFLVPRGKYFVEVEKENYQPLRTEKFTINKNFINQEIILSHFPELETLRIIRWKMVIVILVLIMLVAAGIAFKKYKKSKRKSYKDDSNNKNNLTLAKIPKLRNPKYLSFEF